ncbi:MAG: hypothetical protein AUF79_13880 [Crenarchaeota archaeon 13_1_20CM_2_51_8]|nr:MAG: hypothetical protein AUF79_13880 [Crenarchaeota archaeon 13_1_20CM_2_51_8]
MSDLPDVLREYRVKIIPAGDSGPQPSYPDNLGLRTKFGGLPDAIQGDHESDRNCRECSGRMHFIGQIDSFEFNSDKNPNRKDYGDEQFMFGDVGIIYIWFCFNCLVPEASIECY